MIASLVFSSDLQSKCFKKLDKMKRKILSIVFFSNKVFSCRQEFPKNGQNSHHVRDEKTGGGLCFLVVKLNVSLTWAPNEFKPFRVNSLYFNVFLQQGFHNISAYVFLPQPRYSKKKMLFKGKCLLVSVCINNLANCNIPDL